MVETASGRPTRQTRQVGAVKNISIVSFAKPDFIQLPGRNACVKFGTRTRQPVEADILPSWAGGVWGCVCVCVSGAGTGGSYPDLSSLLPQDTPARAGYIIFVQYFEL